jgi:putative ABC transport system permease protein
LLTAGALFGFIVGMFTATSLSHLIGTQTGTLITAPFSWVEIHYLAGFISIMALLALLPALTVFQKSIIAGLRL